MERPIINIDEDLCDGCGACIPDCPEGALAIVDGKARLVSDIRCDGLGACIGRCPKGAITVETREAAPYDERLVLEDLIEQGEGVVAAHLKHLRDHGEDEYLRIAHEVLAERGIEVPEPVAPAVTAPAPTAKDGRGAPLDGPMKYFQTRHRHGGGCPGSQAASFDTPAAAAPATAPAGPAPSQLGHWPVQLHLVSPMAPYYQGKDVVLSADCVAYALGSFHEQWLAGKSLAIACPKLDHGLDIYQAKLKALIDDARVNTITVLTMEVPCCSGLVHLVRQATAAAERTVPIRSVLVGLRGDILQDEWLPTSAR